jgi:hypothetical protein
MTDKTLACVSPRKRWTTVVVALALFVLFAGAAYGFRTVVGVNATDFGVTLWPEPTASSARITAVVDAVLHKERLAAWFAEQPIARKFPETGKKGKPLPWEALTKFADALTSDDARKRLAAEWGRELSRNEADLRESIRSFHKAKDESERTNAVDDAATHYRDALAKVASGWVKHELPVSEVLHISSEKKVTIDEAAERMAARDAASDAAAKQEQKTTGNAATKPAQSLTLTLQAAAVTFLSDGVVTERIKSAVVDDLSQGAAQQSILTGAEHDYAGRCLWALLAAIFLTAAVSAIVGGFTTVLSLESEHSYGLPVAYCLVVAFGLVVGWQFPSIGPAFLADPLQRYATLYNLSLMDAVKLLDSVGAGAICSLLFVGWASFLVGTGEDHHLGKQFAALRWTFHTSTFVLIAGVLEVYALFQWPSAFLGEHGSALLQNGAKTAAISLGAIFSTLLLLIYLPGARVLVNEADARKRIVPPGKDEPDPKRTAKLDAMMVKHGFDASFSQQAVRFATIFAPLLIAPLADLLDVLTK